MHVNQVQVRVWAGTATKKLPQSEVLMFQQNNCRSEPSPVDGKYRPLKKFRSERHEESQSGGYPVAEGPRSPRENRTLEVQLS